MANNPCCSKSIRQELLDTVHHYRAWSRVFSDIIERVLDEDHLKMAVFDLEHGSSDDQDISCVLEDIKCLEEIVKNEHTPGNMEEDFAPGLRQRKRKFTEPLAQLMYRLALPPLRLAVDPKDPVMKNKNKQGASTGDVLKREFPSGNSISSESSKKKSKLNNDTPSLTTRATTKTAKFQESEDDDE
ncbi:hypothetical protein KCU83_g8340, partial [Aureobasidium melanogenum]